MFGGDIYLKLENLQKTGSFKIGGGDLRHHEKREDIGPGCVVAASAGNQDQGVALQLNILETIVPNGTFVHALSYSVPRTSSPNKYPE